MITTENNNPQEHDVLGCWPTKSLMKYCEKHYPNHITYWQTKDSHDNMFDTIEVDPVNRKIEITTDIFYKNHTTTKFETFRGPGRYLIDMTDLEQCT